jgi:osmotically-inducible protein OsmY
MKFLILIIGIAIGAAGMWFYQSNSGHPQLKSAGDKIETSARSAGNTIQDKLKSWHLSGDDIKADMNKTGRVIREKSKQAGQAISDATADARITASIKAALVKDPELSAWDISVDTTDGVVTLSGSVSNPGLVGKAMLVAMDTEGVRQVVSTLQIKP